MAYHLYSSVYLEEILFSTDTKELLLPQILSSETIFVVQNQSMAQWLKFQIATQLGAFAGHQILFPDQALRLLLDWVRQTQEPRVLFMDDLKLVIYQRLSKWIKAGNSLDFWSHVQEYLCPQGENISNQNLFDLSDQLAGLFYNYGMNCPVLAAALDGDPHSEGPWNRNPHFSWQKILWQEIFGTKDLPGKFIHLGPGLINGAKNSLIPQLSGIPFKKMVLVGSAFLSASAYNFLKTLSDLRSDFEIHHFLFWPFPNGPEYTRNIPSYSALFQDFGAFGVQFAGIFQNNPPIFHHKKIEKKQSPLQDIQKGCLQVSKINLIDDLEFFFKIISCPGPRRELEVLKDEIIHLCCRNPGIQLHEIAVMAPDISDYSSYIASIFCLGEDTDIPFNMCDIPLPLNTEFFSGWLALMDLFGKEINRPDCFKLFRNECFQNAFKIDSETVDLWMEFFVETETYHTGPGPHGLLNAFHRLWAGCSFETSEIFEPVLFQNSKLYPYLESPTRVQSLGRLKEVIDQISSWNRELVHNFEGWVRILTAATDSLLQPRIDDNKKIDEEGRKIAKDILAKLGNLTKDGLSEPDFKIDFQEFKAFILDALKHTNISSRGFLSEGINFGSLRSLRGIPFKHIFLLGLNENRFPRQESNPVFDLFAPSTETGRNPFYGVDPKAISLESQDLYCFLEAFYSSRESFIMGYQGRSALDFGAIPPSQVITLVQEAFESIYPGIIPLEEHKIHGLDSQYFIDGMAGKRGSFDKLHHALSIKINNVNSEMDNQNFWPEFIAEDPYSPEFVSLDILSRFFQNPLSFFAQNTLKLKIQDEDAPEDEAEESWRLDNFQLENEILQRLFFSIQKGAQIDLGELMETLNGSGLIIPSPFTELQETEWENIHNELLEKINPIHWKEIHEIKIQRTWGKSHLTHSFPVVEFQNQDPNKNPVFHNFFPFKGILKAKHFISLALSASLILEEMTKTGNFPTETLCFEMIPMKSREMKSQTFTINWDQAQNFLNEFEAFWLEGTRSPKPLYMDLADETLKIHSDNPTFSTWDCWKQASEKLSLNSFTWENYQDEKTWKDCPAKELFFSDDFDWDPWESSILKPLESLYLPLIQIYRKDK